MMETNSLNSAGFSKFAEDIEAVWDEFEASGYKFPRFMRTWTEQFANDNFEVDQLRTFWVERARESLARAPVSFKGLISRNQHSGLAYYSKFLDLTAARQATAKDELGIEIYNELNEPAVLRFDHSPNRKQLAARVWEELNAEIPLYFTENSVSWTSLADPEKRFFIGTHLSEGMVEFGLFADLSRIHESCPIFSICLLPMNQELVLFVQSMRSCLIGKIEIRFAIVPAGQNIRKLTAVKSNCRTLSLLSDFIPCSDPYLTMISTSHVSWNLRAFASMAGIIRTRMPEAFSKALSGS